MTSRIAIRATKLPADLTDTFTVSREQFEAEFVGARACGVDMKVFYDAHGITPRFLNNPHGRISFGRVLRLRHAVCRAMNDENVGFLDKPSPWGTLAYLCRTMVTSRTLKGALNRYDEFNRMYRPSVACRVVERGGLAYIELAVDNRKRLDIHSYIENSLLFLLSFLLWLADRHCLPRRIDYNFSEPGYAGDYASLVPCEYRFDRPRTQLVIERSFLSAPVIRKGSELNFFLNNHLVYLMELNLSAGTLADRVRRLIASSAGMNAGMDQVANLLNTPETTLRRRLKAEGYPFKVIKENLRRERALYYLVEKHMAVTDVAELLGYSEASAFSRAFKQWTGFAPQNYPS